MAKIVVCIKDNQAGSDGTWIAIKVSCEEPLMNFETSLLLDFDRTPAQVKDDALAQVKAALAGQGYVFVPATDKIRVLGGIT